MALPSSGQISFNDVRTEMEQTSKNDYRIDRWAVGYGIYGTVSNVYTPINVHTGNTGNYTTSPNNIDLNTWHGYDRTLNYPVEDINKPLSFSTTPGALCYPSSMLIYDLGTSNQSVDIVISGSISDFSLVDYITVYYGKPWQSNTNGTGSAQIIYNNTGDFPSGLNTTINYNYVYDSVVGQYVYVVIYGLCP
jgi:hypothetical protein